MDWYRLCSHREAIEEETKYLTWDPHATPKATLDFVTDCEEAWEDDSRGTYVVRPKSGEDGAGEFAGNTGLTIDWEKQTGTLGIWLRKRFWGRGYSGERAAALVELAFDRLDLELVSVTHEAGNEKSRRAIEKYVERFGGQHDILIRNAGTRPDGTTYDSHRYSITREQW
ncbi:GNAT family N-acetyltransferase [Haladaptatus pallidirubidus]|uniref:GNAT family N-acetyltransferase n=1 Tax=Haladaptatus pallidirubidus TaxID=1008152 RepID=UPI0035EEE759